jgi:hypothetical protein
MKTASCWSLAIALVFSCAAIPQASAQKALTQKTNPAISTVVLTRQTGPIATTTLAVPQKAALYRVSLYWEATTLGTTGAMCGSVDWTDYSPTPGTAGFNCIPVAPNTPFGPNYAQSQTFVVQAKPGTPVTFNTFVDISNQLSGSPEYAIFITVETLVP